MKKSMGKTIILILLSAVMIAIFVFSSKVIMAGADQYDEINRLEDSYVTIKSNVTSFREESDGDGGTEYGVYISYSYNGRTFNDIRYTTRSKKPQKRKSEQELCDLTVRPDVYAFLTCPGAVVEEMNLQP